MTYDESKIVGTTARPDVNIANPYEILLDYADALTEQGMRTAQDTVEGAIRRMRRQSEAGFVIAEKLFESAERQLDGVYDLAEAATGAYLDLMFVPLIYYKAVRMPRDVRGYQEPKVVSLRSVTRRTRSGGPADAREHEK